MIRTRFAPSPTGLMHVGAARTALFAWLLAQKEQGDFILRIEDTDKTREVEGSIDHILESLTWLGIEWQEGIDIGGTHGPYLQSERLTIYKDWAQKLIDTGRAYADPYTQEELEAFRTQAKAEKRPFLYREHRPEHPPVWDGSQPLRFKSEPKACSWQDAVMGELSAAPEAIDDFILMKSDGYPTYNFAHIIDDELMEITHVLRSQEFISSTPKFLNLYEALDITPPTLATLPFVMAIDGKKKLGKRDGAKDILDYQAEGYLPETLVNFLATLGWNDGTEQEVFTTKELVEKFSLDRVQKSPARFDESRLLWLNGQHIRRLSVDELYERSTDFWPQAAENKTAKYKKKILELVQDRLKVLGDLPIITEYFFYDPAPNWAMVDDSKQLNKVGKTRLVELLEIVIRALKEVDFTPEHLQNELNKLLEATNEKPAVLFSIVRLAISWAPFSPSLNETLALIGKEAVLARLGKAVETAPDA